MRERVADGGGPPPRAACALNANFASNCVQSLVAVATRVLVRIRLNAGNEKVIFVV